LPRLEFRVSDRVWSVEELQRKEVRRMDDAIERVRRMTERVRDQAYARFAVPWRFEGYPLAELAEPPSDAGRRHDKGPVDGTPVLRPSARPPDRRPPSPPVQVLGPYSQVCPGSPWAPDEGQWEFYALLAQASGIRAGTSEILRNILAERVLGLPKD
jgi:hypothetical protein